MNYTIQEKIDILSKQTLKIKDVCILFDCGYQKARKMADQFYIWYENRYGHKPYDNTIPTSEFVMFSGFDEGRVLRYVQNG